MFRAALLMIAKRWKKLVPSSIEWINKLQYIHNGLLTGNKKKKKSTDACNYIDESQIHYLK